jgi:hypothetical protein
MVQTNNINKINEPSQEHVYRFPSWYQPKPVQAVQQSGTEPVQPMTQETGQGDMCHPDSVPVLCTGNGAPCTENSAIATREDAPQPVENAVHTFASAPKVPEVPVSEGYNRAQTSTIMSSVEVPVSRHHPPPYPGRPVGTPFRPGQQVWLYRWDDHTPRFDTPVRITEMRTLWPGEQDIGWRNAAGELTWHNARLAVAVETQEMLRQAQDIVRVTT